MRPFGDCVRAVVALRCCDVVGEYLVEVDVVRLLAAALVLLQLAAQLARSTGSGGRRSRRGDGARGRCGHVRRRAQDGIAALERVASSYCCGAWCQIAAAAATSISIILQQQLSFGSALVHRHRCDHIEHVG